MGKYLVTGAAGFIGAKVSEFLLAQGHEVIGVDNLNDAYDVCLKHWRLEQLQDKPSFEFHHLDICRWDQFSGSPKARGTKIQTPKTPRTPRIPKDTPR